MNTQRPHSSNEDEIIIEKLSKTDPSKVKKYRKGRFLGKGGFAKVYEFTDLDTQMKFASKIIQKSSLNKSRAKQKLMTEIKIHKSISHPNVVQFKHVFEDSENVYILLEICDNQTVNELLKRRKRLTEIEVMCYMQQIISALDYCHKQQIIHRDLKLGNMFLSKDMQIKIGDFGLATKLEYEGEKKKTICGTPNYIAPEILEGKLGHSFEVDFWSLGVIMYTLIIGKPPFETNDVKQTYKLIKSCQYSFPDHIKISNNAKNLIRKMIQLDPSARPTVNQMLAHEFFEASIPSLMPVSTLTCPPSSTFLNTFHLEKKDDNNNTNSNLNSYKVQTLRENTNIANMDRPQSVKPYVSYQNQYSLPKNNDDILSLNQLNQNEIFYRDQKQQQTENEIWVKKWVDYSSKYGLGYLLNNGAAGVCFNDSTNILINKNAANFIYVERQGPEKKDVISSHDIKDYPQNLHKKVTLLQHFQGYLEGENNSSPKLYTEKTDMNDIFVKKWMKTKHAIMLRLNNKLVQVIFQDQTQILLQSEFKIVTYLNKKSERLNFPLNTALESSNNEMTKRLKYTKDILTQMLGGNNIPFEEKKNENQISENVKFVYESKQMNELKNEQPEVLRSDKSPIRHTNLFQSSQTNFQVPTISLNNNYQQVKGNYQIYADQKRDSQIKLNTRQISLSEYPFTQKFY